MLSRLDRPCFHADFPSASTDAASARFSSKESFILGRNNPPLSRHGRDLDGESEALEPVNESFCLLAFVAVVEVAWAEVLVEGAVFEHVVGGGEYRGGNRPDGLFGTAPGADAQVLGLEVTSVGAGGCPGALNQRGL